VDVFIDRLAAEKGSGFSQVLRVGAQTKSLEHGHHAASGFGERSVLDKQSAPDGVGLLRLRQSEILIGRGVRGSKKFSL